MEALDAEPESDVKTEILCSLCIFSCVCVCALASGLTMGLVSLDETNLKIKAMVGTPEEKEAAEKLLPIIADHHLLLVSLLLCNCIAGEALPLFLDAVVSPILAVVLSVTFVLLFGEIIPSAIFTGPHQLIIASSCASTVNFILILFYPISKPIAMFLDYLFSDEHAKGVFIPRNELEALMILQTNKTSSSDGGEVSGGQQHFDGLNVEELRLVQGVLNLPKKCACDIMVPAKDLFMLSSHRVLDETTVEEIYGVGHSRIPVYYKDDKNKIVGILLSKSLMKRDKSEKRVWELPLQKAFCVPPQQPLLTLMKKFQEGRSHLAIVSSDPDADVPLSDEPCPTKVLGVVTIEDVIEEIIQEEIYDEKDKSYIDQQQINPRLMASASEDEPLVPHEVRRCRSLNESDLNISYRSQLRGFAAKGRKRGSDKYRAAIIGEEQSRYGSVASPSIV